jgi:hypothetical protein
MNQNLLLPKIKFFLTILFISLLAQLNATPDTTKVIVQDVLNDTNNVIPNNLQVVYICTGSYAYAYHSNNTCAGLNNCKSSIVYLDENQAVNAYGRKPCCKCWRNVGYNCKDDNPYNSGTYSNGGGGDGAAMAMIVIGGAIVATSVFILSNEVYVAPAYSFYKGKRYLPSSIKKIKQKPALGFCFQLRKNFENSGLEYGFSYFSYEQYVTYVDPKIPIRRRIVNKFGGNLNYVHNFFNDRMPENVLLFAGPTLKFVDRFGAGGIVGISYKVHDRVKFDFRYELSSQSNQIQLGLQILYQKEYFWKKRRNK